MISTLETPRLILRPLELPDAEQTQLLFPHWDIVRYLQAWSRGRIRQTARSPTIAT